MGIIKAFNDLFKSKGKGNVLAVEQTANGGNEPLVINPSNRFEPIKSIVLELSKEAIFDLSINEAIEHFKYVRPDAITYLREFLFETFSEDNWSVVNGLSLRKTGTQLTKEEKKQAGLKSNSFFPKEAYEILTDKGRAEPAKAIDITIDRASNSISVAYAVKNKINEAKNKGLNVVHFTHTIFSSCPTCKALDDQIVDLDTLFFLPPKACTCESRRSDILCKYDFSYGA